MMMDDKAKARTIFFCSTTPRPQKNLQGVYETSVYELDAVVPERERERERERKILTLTPKISSLEPPLKHSSGSHGSQLLSLP
jgi:hypothetical protein